MASPNKAKGTAWESALVKLFTSRGIRARRVAQAGRLDTGDIHGIEPFVGQAKAYRDMLVGIREGVDGAELQAPRAGEPFGVAFIKRPRKSTGDGYAVMTIDTWTRVPARLRETPEGGSDA